MKLPVVALAGRARVGKDSAADVLYRAIPHSYRYSFADPIRAMLNAGFGIDMNDPEWIASKEDPIPWLADRSPRQLMQTLGTEWGRELVHPDVWLMAATARLRPSDTMIVSDVRFDNEATWVRAQGGCLVHVHRTNAPRIAGEARGHASEGGVAVEDGDWILYNDGTLRDLQLALRHWVDGPHPGERLQMFSTSDSGACSIWRADAPDSGSGA